MRPFRPDDNEPDLIPPPDTIRPVLARTEERAAALRKLLRLSLTYEQQKAELAQEEGRTHAAR